MTDQYLVGSGPINLGAATQLCTLELNSQSTRRVQGVNAIRVSFNGVTSTAVPVNCQIARVSNTPSGTAIPTNYGPNPHDPSAPVSITTAKTASTATPGAWTTAPTLSSIVWEMEISPTSGYAEWFPLGMEIDMAISSWLGVFMNAPAAVVAYTSLLFTE